MKPVYNCSLVLASHGSISNTVSNRPQFELATQLEKFGIFSKVTPAFLNSDPHASEVLDSLPSGDVIVIPMMTSDGHYSNSVIPEKLQANTRLEEFRLMITPSIGVQNGINNLVLARVIEIILEHSLAPDDTSIVIVGHGGDLNENDEGTTYDLAESIRMTLSGIAVEVGFLDQAPQLQVVSHQIQTRNKIVIPFFMSRNIQSAVEIPAAFGLPAGSDWEYPIRMETPSGVCVCDRPVGEYPEIVDLCLEMATNRMAGLQAA